MKVNDVVSTPATATATAVRMPKPEHLVALGSFGVSLQMPISYDEAYWIAIARMVESGRSLYEGAIDNKSPVVYGILWALDSLPGPYVLWRSVVLGALAWVLFRSFSLLMPTGGWRPIWLSTVLTTQVLLLTEFTIYPEILALPLLLAAIRGNHRVGAVAALTLVATAVDPRVVLLSPGIVLLTPEDERGRLIGYLVAGWTMVGALVLVSPDLRYGLVEMNLASRGADDWNIGRYRQTLIALVGYLPLVTSLDSARRSAGTNALVLGATVIALASLLPFPHYWVYLSVGLVLLVTPKRVPSPPLFAVILVIAAFVPSTIRLTEVARAHQDLETRSAQVLEVLSETVPADGVYVVFGSLPQVVAERPQGYALRAPTSLYLGLETSRSPRHLAELPELMEGTTAVVDSGGLSSDRRLVYTQYLPAYDILTASLPEFPCRLAVGQTTIWLRGPECSS